MFLENRYIQMAMGGFGVLLLALLVFLMVREPAPEANMWCVFKGKPNQVAIWMGRVKTPIDRISISGTAGRPSDSVAFPFEGEARIGEGRTAGVVSVRGEAFVTDGESVNGLKLILSGEKLGRDELTIETLNNAGNFAFSRNDAYVYRDRRFRLSHPMFYACRVADGALTKDETANLTSIIETKVKKERPDLSIDDYTRYYAMAGENAVEAVFLGPRLADPDAGPGSKVHWVDRAALPKILDGGCSVLNVRYNARSDRLTSLECNGEA